MDSSTDEFVLEILPDEDLPQLRQFYNNLDYAPYIYSFIDTAIKWKIKKSEYITFYVLKGKSWETDGTFIAHLQWSCYDFVLFTKEDSQTLEQLQKLIKASAKTFNWKSHPSLFYAIHQKHFPTLFNTFKNLQIPISGHNVYDIWWMPKEQAKNLTIDVPPEVYVGKITKEHIPLINDVWPNKYSGSLEYLSTFMEMNGAQGLFLKNGNVLVSWIFKVHLGTMAILQTAEEYKGKGYGGLITKVMAKEIAEDGHDPLGTVLTTNIPSQKMFRKIGFKILDQVYYLHT